MKWLECVIKGALTAALAVSALMLIVTGLAQLVTRLMDQFGQAAFPIFIAGGTFIVATVFFTAWFAEEKGIIK